MDLKENLEKYLSKEEIDNLFESFANKEQKGLFLNTNKMSEETLLSLFPNLKPHPVVPNGFLFDKDEYQLGNNIYHELGCYYIQDPSAMLVSYFLPIKEGMRVLDMCAAPGGKTIQASLKMKDKGILVANDLSKTRAITLLSNIERLGLGNVMVTSLDFSKIYKEYLNTFDAIILDAPCSGSGMFRKSEEMKKDWSMEKVIKNSFIQKDLILIAYSMLKEGGTLIYSTCSYSFEEDEEVVSYLLDNTDAELVDIPHFTGEYRHKSMPQTVHLFPSLFSGEGQYIALIKKPGELTLSKDVAKNISRKVISKGGESISENYLLNSDRFLKLSELSLRPGLFISTSLKDKVMPTHHYSHYVKDAKNIIDLDEKDIKKYILGESLSNIINDNGYYFVSYKGIILGVAHLVNNQLKNLYPKGLRKRSY